MGSTSFHHGYLFGFDAERTNRFNAPWEGTLAALVSPPFFALKAFKSNQRSNLHSQSSHRRHETEGLHPGMQSRSLVLLENI